MQGPMRERLRGSALTWLLASHQPLMDRRAFSLVLVVRCSTVLGGGEPRRSLPGWVERAVTFVFTRVVGLSSISHCLALSRPPTRLRVRSEADHNFVPLQLRGIAAGWKEHAKVAKAALSASRRQQHTMAIHTAEVVSGEEKGVIIVNDKGTRRRNPGEDKAVLAVKDKDTRRRCPG